MKKPETWKPPDEWLKISTIDVHAEGEPLRIVVSGFPEPKGKTILDRRRYAMENLDDLRTALMGEPRGHADMYGCLITPPQTAQADFGILFMHNEGFSTMCGHGIIGAATAALETGMIKKVEPETKIKIDTPAGLVTAHARVFRGRVKSVRFHNVPSFVLALDENINLPGLGNVTYDLAFGGAFYAYVKAVDLNLKGTPSEHYLLIEKGVSIKRAITARRPVVHPFEKDLSFLYGTIFTAPSASQDVFSRNVCIFADGEVDRSPTGTGVSGYLAILYRRGQIKVNEPIIIESIISSRFTGCIVEATSFGPHPAIIPEIEGSAYITGRHEFLIDPMDPLRNGFILR